MSPSKSLWVAFTSGCRAAILLVSLTFLAATAHAQAPLRLVDDDTEVSEISFKFADTQTLPTRDLEQQIALEEPSVFDQVRDVLPLLSTPPTSFSPIVLQKDVVRLRNYYRSHGFLHTQITYEASQLDTTSNTIHVIFSIREGPPLIIQDVGFFTPDSNYAVTQFEGQLRERWIDFRDRSTFQRGERFTDYKYTRLKSDIVAWLQNRGFAFPQVEGDSTIDRQANTADIRFFVDAGPRGYISEINVEGNESVSDEVIRRELPFEVGDRFSASALDRGQQELFALNLFRLAVVSVPDDQPRDSTVVVNVRVREASPRYVRAQTGYARGTGLLLEGLWRHRNFLGGARTFTTNVTWNSGVGSYTSARPFINRVDRRFRASFALRQPYLFTTNLSGVVSPYYLYEDDPLLTGSEYGLNTTLLYEILPFRVINLNHNFSRATVDRGDQHVSIEEDDFVARDLFNKSIFTLTATMGKARDFLKPEKGFLLRPFAEFAGHFLASDIDYYKLGGEASVYQPITDQLTAAVRLNGGRLTLLGDSRYDESNVFNEAGLIVQNGLLETRFDRIRFYAGGGSDVRGWAPRMLGPKVAQADTLYMREDGKTIQRNGVPVPARNDAGHIRFRNYRYEILGGLTKLTANLEMRFPFPWFGPSWHAAAFLDFGQVAEQGLPLSGFRYGTGAGLRYETAIGYLRLDLAYKINPTQEDLISPRESFLRNIGRNVDAETSIWQRFRIHLNIGQAF